MIFRLQFVSKVSPAYRYLRPSFRLTLSWTTLNGDQSRVYSRSADGSPKSRDSAGSVRNTTAGALEIAKLSST